MRAWLWMALLSVAAISGVAAQQQPPADKADDCLTLNNRILGPRSAGRPLPLLKGDAAHGFHPACAASWSKLSPGNQAVPVVGCFHASLLQLGNDAACGPGTGLLWVNSRWVVTSAEVEHPVKRLVICQQLETHAWAGTRDFKIDCGPRKKELPAEPAPAASPTHPEPAAPPAAAPPRPADAAQVPPAPPPK